MAGSGSQPLLDATVAPTSEADAGSCPTAHAPTDLRLSAGPAATTPTDPPSTDPPSTAPPSTAPPSSDPPPVDPPPVDTGSAAAGSNATGSAATEKSPENAPQPTATRAWWMTLWGRWQPHAQAVLRSRSTPGFLVSFVVHTLLLLSLAVWTIAGPGRGGFTGGIIESHSLDVVETEISMAEPMLASGAVSEQATDSAQAAEIVGAGTEPQFGGALGSALQSISSQVGPGAGTPAPVNQSAAGQVMNALSSSINASLAPTGVEGRTPQSRERLAMERGGNGDSERAVELALEWLAAHQQPNGSWSLVHTQAECGPYCTHPGSPERYQPAATGLALLAFLGAGYTHRDGKHHETVRRGIYYLLQIMEQTPQGGSFLFNSAQGMYNHGIATFALCEAYQLSHDESLRQPCQSAVDFIVFAQNDHGGWGYLPNQPGDLTLTGWQTMALKSADAAGLYIPAQSIVLIDRFLDSQGDKDKTFYGYGSPAPKNETCTAIGLLLRMFRGWPHSDPRVLTGAAYLERQGVSSHDIYRNYYLTLLLFHVGGPTFQQWNPRMRDALIKSQSQSGHAKGSWYFEDKWAEVGGRLYVTAMAAMTLEVYYRFSPLYMNVDKPFEF